MCFKKIERFWKNNKGFRIIWFLVVPLVLATGLFPYLEIPVSFSFDNDTNTTYVTISEEDVYHPIWKSSIRRIFSTPFDFNFYQIVIADTAIAKDLSGCEMWWNFTVGEESKILTFGEGSKVSFDMIKIEERYLWNKEVFLEVDYEKMVLESHCTFIPSFVGYAMPYRSEILAMWILFFLAWWGINFLGFQVYKEIKGQ
jgi:hypothetical protein